MIQWTTWIQPSARNATYNITYLLSTLAALDESSVWGAKVRHLVVAQSARQTMLRKRLSQRKWCNLKQMLGEQSAAKVCHGWSSVVWIPALVAWQNLSRWILHNRWELSLSIYTLISCIYIYICVCVCLHISAIMPPHLALKNWKNCRHWSKRPPWLFQIAPDHETYRVSPVHAGIHFRCPLQWPSL